MARASTHPASCVGDRFGRALLCVLVLVGHAANSVSAQTLTTGAISGEVRSEAGVPLGGVTITVTSRAGGGTVSLQRSTRSGSFALPFLEPGLYDALFEQLGFYPVLLEGIAVDPGERSALQVLLPPVEGTPERVEVRRRTAAAARGATPAQRWLMGPVASLPLETSGLGALADLSSRAGPASSFEGLPAVENVFVVDGFPRADRPSPAGRLARAAALRMSFLSHADLMGGAVDVEWPSAAGGSFTGITRLGAGPTSGRVFGDWAGAALAGGDVASFQNYRAGAEVGGTLADSARFLISADVEREDIPLASSFVPREGLTALATTVEQLGGDLSPWTQPSAVRTERATIFAAAGMPLGTQHQLRAHGTFTTIPHLDAVDVRTGQRLAQGSTTEARELFVGATLSSRIGTDALNEFSLSFESGRVERVGPARDAALTEVASLGTVFGSDDVASSVESLRQIYARETVQLQRGAHNLKIGGWLSYRPYTLDYYEDRAPHLVYATPEGLVDRVGSYSQLVGTPTLATFDAVHYALYAQDEWIPDAALRIQVGVRLNIFRLPDTVDVTLNTRFVNATSRSNRDFDSRATAVEPRVALVWNPAAAGAWLVRASATIDASPVGPAVIAELMGNIGALNELAAVGPVTTWPDPPPSSETTVVGESLTLLGPEFSGARTTRLSGGITRALGTFTAGVEAVYRSTEFLPRRRDLNLLPVPATSDQYGRPIYGPLEKLGGVLAARPEDNRRLSGFSHVWAIEAVGTSRYTGLTLSLERTAPAGLGLLASYTYSLTEDDWLGGLDQDPHTQLSPFPDGVQGVDWADGRSDFDVPHRLALGAELRLPGRFGPRVAALYRRDSGLPFTPGFRPGVDVNADGSGSNDPGFLDPEVPGLEELFAAWPCLRSDVGRFARRNGCRTEDVQSLDARLSLEVLRSERFGAHLVVDGLDLIASERVGVDRAVFLIDPARDLDVSADGRTTTIPLVANPGFGQPLTRFAPQRRIRIGLRVRY